MVKLTTVENTPRKVYYKETQQANKEKLLAKYGQKKKLPHGYELAALVALSHFPELTYVAIDFKFKQSDTTLSARPRLLSVLVPGRLRKYEVMISKRTRTSKEPVMLKNLDFNMQVGVIGHELAHIADYVRKTPAQVIRYSIMYMFESFRKKIENRTDRLTIKRGLGYQILAYARLVEKLKKDYPQEKYYQDYNNIYLSASEIESRMARLQIYQGAD